MSNEIGLIEFMNKIFPGKTWLDTDGKRIEAHGGSVFYSDGLYYWYGENKEFTDGVSDIITYGVRAYSSADLINWKNIGLIIPPSKDQQSSICATSKAERPHIVYNKKTGKYVCYIKVIKNDGRQLTTILTADKFLGPYCVVRENWAPLGMNAGDFDLQVDEETGKGYYIFECVHTHTVIAELTDDYLDTNGIYSEHFKNGYPPYVREACAHFMRKGKHYLLTSGTTGYYPNPSELAVADDWHGPYKILGNPHKSDLTDTSFHSQISSVLKVQGKDMYIACADRWLPDRQFVPYELYAELFATEHDPSFDKKADWSKLTEMLKEHGINPEQKANTSISEYVWLPIRFENDMGYIEWKDEWSPNIL